MTFSDLTRLAREIESSDTYDPGAQQCNLTRLRELREHLRRQNEPALATAVGAAAQLIQALMGSRETISREEIKGIACRMLTTLGSDLGDLPIREDEPPVLILGEDLTIAVEEETAAPVPAPAAPPQPPAAAQPPAPEQEPPAVQAPPPAARSRKPASPSAPQQPKRPDMVFGHILIELGHTTRKQVADALRFHRARGPRLGECLLLQGAIGPEQLLNVLKIQDLLRTTPQGITPESLARYKEPKRSRGAAAGASPDGPLGRPRDTAQRVTEGIFFGEVLLGAEMITNDELEKALHIHHLQGIPVGEALIQMGVLTAEEVRSGLELQKQLRRIAGRAA